MPRWTRVLRHIPLFLNVFYLGLPNRPSFVPGIGAVGQPISEGNVSISVAEFGHGEFRIFWVGARGFPAVAHHLSDLNSGAKRS